MKLVKSLMIFTSLVTGLLFADQMPKTSMQPSIPAAQTDCSNMSADMQVFTSQLSSENQAMFCGKFNDAQRMEAMQMASQKDGTGKAMMTNDQSVEKVASDNNLIKVPKSTGGCPLK